MTRIGKMAAVILGAGLLLVVGAMFGPRTATAIVATLVQVANTPTTAIPAVHAPSASELYVYTCVANYGGNSSASCSFPTVPAGKTLIAEAFSISSASSPGADPSQAYLCTENTCHIAFFVPMFQQASAQGADFFTGAIGAHFSMVTTPACVVQLSASSGSNFSFNCTISGYLVPAS
jgi:hypothetical protein